MTDLSSAEDELCVGDVVRFRSDLFFDGAVQLRWVHDDSERAKRAAENFVFHGPRYHAVHPQSVNEGYELKDTATFVENLVEEVAAGEEKQGNPFSIAIAGYGSGKSHLAVTIAELLTGPKSSLSEKIQRSVASADSNLGLQLSNSLERLRMPALVVPLDGMANFNLGSEIARQVIRKLRQQECDLSVIEELSPRFKIAENFVSRNIALRSSDFSDVLGELDVDSIIEKLRDRDEITYKAVDVVYERANGAHIPVEGNESIQDLIATVATHYCGAEGPFCGIVVLFDEFGRFLEYAAENPHLAGDSALQQLFQGIQDAGGRARFLGFIQYELKAYISRLDRRDLMHLQRYITRFEAAKKSYLSTNLETLFAYLIEKKIPDFIECNVLNDSAIKSMHQIFMLSVPDANQFPIWSEINQFKDVICAGCWPLDPFAVWFLTRQQDVVQSRSALIIARDAIEKAEELPSIPLGASTTTVSAADLLLTGMLPEFLAAEQAKGGTVAETLHDILVEREAHLTKEDRKLLAGVAVALKLGVKIRDQSLYKQFLGFSAGLTQNQLERSLSSLSHDLGVLEWNEDFGQYELVQDAATRGQFARLLRSHYLDLSLHDARKFFISYGRFLCNLLFVDPGFANENSITTQDWRFDPLFASSDTVADCVRNAFKEWSNAQDVNDSKGRIIYTFVSSDQNFESVRDDVESLFSFELRQAGVSQAPIWVVYLCDPMDRLADVLKRYWILECRFSEQDRDRYRRFVSTELEKVQGLAQNYAAEALKERLHHVAGFYELENGRLSKVGKEIFFRIYPNVVPFPFDGFATAAGVGGPAKKDCLEIIRVLSKREFNDEWIQSRPVRLRNRSSQVLVNAWQVLDREGNVSNAPRNTLVASILDKMDHWHATDSSRTLEDTRRALFFPPYGLNVASTGLFIGLFLGRRSPRWRISLEGFPCDVSSWLGEALKASDFDKKVLAQTCVYAVSEGALERWRNLIDQWMSATRHQERLEYMEQAKLMVKDDPVPEELVYKYEKSKEEAKQSQEQIASFRRKFEEVQRDLERQVGGSGSITSLALADRVIELHRLVSNGEWNDREIEETEKLFEIVKEWVSQEAPHWISRAYCRSPQHVADFRKKMEMAESTLSKLGFPNLSQASELQKQKAISTVEERFKFHASLSEAQQFVEISTVSSSLSIRQLKDMVERAERLSRALAEGGRNLNDPELEECLLALDRVSKSAGKAIGSHKSELALVYETKVDSLDSAYEVRSRLFKLREVFEGQRDLEDIEDVRKQLEKVCVDLDAWSGLVGNPQQVRLRLREAIEDRCLELERWCQNEDVEPVWNFYDIYESFARGHVASLEEKSKLWAESSIPELEDVPNFSMEEARRKLESLINNVPAYLSDNELDRLTVACETLKGRIEEIDMSTRRQAVDKWLQQFGGLKSRIDQLSKTECEELLRILRAPPQMLSPEHHELIAELVSNVERRLDELDVSDIVARIERLGPKSLALIAQYIRKMLDHL